MIKKFQNQIKWQISNFSKCLVYLNINLQIVLPKDARGFCLLCDHPSICAIWVCLINDNTFQVYYNVCYNYYKPH